MRIFLCYANEDESKVADLICPAGGRWFPPLDGKERPDMGAELAACNPHGSA
jgi:hypothetical protein